MLNETTLSNINILNDYLQSNPIYSFASLIQEEPA